MSGWLIPIKDTAMCPTSSGTVSSFLFFVYHINLFNMSVAPNALTPNLSFKLSNSLKLTPKDLKKSFKYSSNSLIEGSS